MRLSTSCRLALSMALLICFKAPVIGEEADGDDPVFVLPEFVVSLERDTGYQATNSMTGTFLDTPLKISPFSIDVFTVDLIADTGSTNLREVLAYDSGLQLENTIAAQGDGQYSMGVEFDSRGINNNETDIVTRGFRAPTLKNGFFTQTRVDTVNIGRIERAGGPQSLLYGIGAISGITNVITKRPLTEPRYNTEFFVGSRDFLRATAEATGPVFKNEDYQIHYIVSAAYQEEGTEFPHESTTSKFISPAIQFRGWDRTTGFLSFEKGLRKRNGVGPYDTSHPRTGLINPETGQLTGILSTGDSGRFLENFLGLGRRVNLGGPDVFIDDDVETLNIEVTQRIGTNYRLLAAFNRDKHDRDERAYALAPRIRQTFVPGEPTFDDLIFAMGDRFESRETDQARVAILASYEFLGGQHSFVFGRQELSQYRTEMEFPETSQIEVRNQFSVWPADGSVIRFQNQPLIGPRWENYYNEWYQGHYLIYQGSIWQGRINPVIGYRWDRSHTRFLRRNFDANGQLGDVYDPLVERGSVNGYANGGEPFRVQTPTYGLSVSITDNLAIYGTYAEGIALSNIAQRDGLGRGFPPEFTRNKEVGLKVSFLDGKLSGRVSAFELQKRGGVRYSFYVPNPSRARFNPDEPITAAMPVGTAANPRDLRRFMEFMGLYDSATGQFLQNPNSLPGVERVTVAGTVYFIFPFGDPNNPGSYDAASNSAPAGYGTDLLNFFQYAREREAAGVGFGAPEYMWAYVGNQPGEDRGAYHNFNEESRGFEVRLQVEPISDWQMIFSYTYNTVEISQAMAGLVDQEIVTGMEPVFWFLNPDDFADPKRFSTYRGRLHSGISNTDVPVHSFTFWSKYAFTDGWFEGLDLRLGARYTSERAAESPWGQPGGAFSSSIEDGFGENVKAPVPAHTIYDLGLGYRWTWREVDWTLNINVRNVFNKERLTAISERRTYFGEPALTEFYLTPRDVRVSLRVDF